MSLSIKNAQYGSVPHNKMADVTSLVVAAVSGDSVRLKVNADTMKGDPAPGRGKRLYVDYTLNGTAGTAEAGERRTLKIG